MLLEDPRQTADLISLGAVTLTCSFTEAGAFNPDVCDPDHCLDDVRIKIVL